MEALGINPSGLLTQIISFLILFAVLYALLYKPLLRVMDQRSSRIKESLEAAERAQTESACSGGIIDIFMWPLSRRLAHTTKIANDVVAVR